MEPDLIDQKLKDPNCILKLEVMNFLSPVTACINQVWFQLSMLTFGVCLCVEAYRATSSFSVYGLSRYRELRLDMIIKGQTHSDFSKIFPHVNGEIHILRAGCSIASKTFTTQNHSNLSPIMVIPFSDPLEMDGFSIKLSQTNISASVRFILQGALVSDDGWMQYGQTTQMRKLCGEIRFLDSNDEMLLETGQAIYDLRAPWPLFVESSICYILLSCSCLSMAVMGFRKNHPHAKMVLIITMASLALVEMIAGGGYCFLGMWRESFTLSWNVARIFHAVVGHSHLSPAICIYQNHRKMVC
jgi:hypothetical protein